MSVFVTLTYLNKSKNPFISSFIEPEMDIFEEKL